MRTVYTGQAHETDLMHMAPMTVGLTLVPGTPAVMVRMKTEPSPHGKLAGGVPSQ